MGKRQLKPRAYNSGTMTKAMFFGWIKNGLRRMSMHWKPPSELLKEKRVSVKGKRHKFEYPCAECGRQFKRKDIAIDHIIQIGHPKDFEDFGGIIERMFVEKSGYQILCNYKKDEMEKHGNVLSCHHQKTQKERGR